MFLRRRAGRRYYQPGFTGWGRCAEYVALPYADVNLVRLPDAMSFTTAALLGCRFATAYRAAVAQGRTRPGEWVAVHDCRGGLSATMIARALDARDRRGYRRGQAGAGPLLRCPNRHRGESEAARSRYERSR